MQPSRSASFEAGSVELERLASTSERGLFRIPSR